VAVVLGYTVLLFALSRRRRGLPNPAPTSLFFVYMVPCYNEELVVGQTLQRLLASRVAGYEGFAVLVVDDGSDDATASVVASFDDPRVWLLSRRLPDARKGKGEALNAAYRHLRDSDLLAGRDLSQVVVCVMDADGRLEPNALYEVGPYFADPRAGAVQVGVRMYNAAENRLTRMQDFEFVTFTEIFQRGRQLVGSVGLGGNGQFARLTALLALGDAPWTDFLTEDLDLGIRFLIGGWTNNFCPTTHVNQQAVTGLRRLLRQRVRWFQGHLQCWARLPDIFRSKLRVRATVDLVQHLLSPDGGVLPRGPGGVGPGSAPVANRLVLRPWRAPVGAVPTHLRAGPHLCLHLLAADPGCRFCTGPGVGPSVRLLYLPVDTRGLERSGTTGAPAARLGQDHPNRQASRDRCSRGGPSVTLMR
jgi:cellulose synthase/poly-beta-1,6-N-acetylglucosamine synthase-like glycosyltransferase